MIDTSYDFRTDAGGKDPDQTSATLRRYHQLLWSKPLPSGAMFDLSSQEPGVYLHHHSQLGEFLLSSDSITHSYSKWASMAHIMQHIPDQERDEFMHLGYTIGGFLIFPSNKIDGKSTINGARGMSRVIADRFDLTLECIRRLYDGQPSPLDETLTRYRSYFDLFEDFKGYVQFFLLDDLVSSDYTMVNFWMPFDNFQSPPVPSTLSTYLDYRQNVTDFIHARNQRIIKSQESMD